MKNFDKLVNKILNENAMHIELLKIDKNEHDPEYDHFETQGGSVYLKVNGKHVEVIVQPSGDFDFEGDVLNDDEMDAVLDFVNSNEEVNQAFPMDEEYED
jgi:hypothetical protein